MNPPFENECPACHVRAKEMESYRLCAVYLCQTVNCAVVSFFPRKTYSSAPVPKTTKGKGMNGKGMKNSPANHSPAKGPVLTAAEKEIILGGAK